jgi:FkbM family methyltransferase
MGRRTLAGRTLQGGRALYGAALRAVYTRAGLPWAVHDERVRIDPRVRHLIPHDGEPALLDFLRRTIKPGDIVLDVGAFLGVYAILAARRAGLGGSVVAFEPTPSSAAIARRHFAYNGLSDRIMLVQAAVSDRTGRAVLHEYAEPYVNSLAAAADTAAPPSHREVATVTIDDVCRSRGIVPSLIRMDVQGAEIHALRGARETIRAAGGRLMIVAEMHPQCWPAFGIDESVAVDAIDGLGLIASPLVSGRGVFDRDAHAVLVPARVAAAVWP